MTDLTLDPVTGVIKAIASMATSPIKNQLERNERVIQLRNKLNLPPDHPPADFTGVYQYALVDYGVDKPQPILELFRQKEIIQAFRQAFEQNDQSILVKKREDFLDWNILGDRIRELNYDIKQEFADFQAAFIKVANSTRTPADVIQIQKIDNLENLLVEIVERLIALPPLTLDQLWDLLVDNATKTDQMKPEIANNLGMWNPAPKVPRGTPFHFVINLATSGYLILLEKNPDQQIWCLSPSFLAPPSRLEAGQVKLPLAYQDTFTADSVGREQMLAIISQDKLNLDWLPREEDEPLEMRKEYLTELLEYVQGDFGVQILYAEYRVAE
ncbi:DUF4384 domain-containing protein [Limnofasciculus baicalensis]|uniref:DUF4384 domain-containing protein n=1 Tax=Limnofasciculus baicalensis BBK-W-15 TaxID=2699891 RepID=A0AAE3GPV5_9CYAN|nr:DUF4384 domain-containing protein [Limnofasciculus baicalensis]MCP2727638.1 DUF4384 domain-containing protein [Limnofasciculus baicalensis BBK-W-15]